MEGLGVEKSEKVKKKKAGEDLWEETTALFNTKKFLSGSLNGLTIGRTWEISV